jgi:tRNA A37 threonylcarbamoyladenosine synthetase subunit TsaC/SUA5/YrdC
LATTLIPPGETEPLHDPHDIRERFEKLISCVLDAGACASEPTTVIDLTGDAPEILRLGRGSPSNVGL